MYVHVGEDILVRTKDIVAIIDKDTVNTSEIVKEYLNGQNENIIHLAKGSYKSLVVTTDKIYYSPLASGTLKKRSSKLTVQEF